MATLETLDFGAGRPLVILHGLFGSARNWASIARRLGEMRRVLSVDLRNHGGSPWLDEMTYPAMAGDVRDIIAPLGPSALLGHSMGGKAAMTTALLWPGLVERLVVVDIAPVAYPRRHHAGYIEAMLGVDLATVERRSQADARLKPAVPDPALRAFLMQNLVAEEGGMRWRLNLEVLGRALPDIMDWPEQAVAGRRYDGPALFLAGGASDYVRPEAHETIRALFPKADIRTLPGAGHWPHAEQPEPFLRMVRDFL